MSIVCFAAPLNPSDFDIFTDCRCLQILDQNHQLSLKGHKDLYVLRQNLSYCTWHEHQKLFSNAVVSQTPWSPSTIFTDVQVIIDKDMYFNSN